MSSFDTIESADKIKVLALDDDSLVRRILKDLLSPDYQLKTVASCREFNDVLIGFNPDVILLDLVLPDGDGFDLCRELRANSQYESVFIIMITSANDNRSIEKGYEAGANDYIRKPFVPFEVKSKIANCKNILIYQNKLYSAFNYQLEFSKRLYKLNRMIQKNINIHDRDTLLREFEHFNDVLEAGYIEVILYEKGEQVKIFSRFFDNRAEYISSDRLRSKGKLVHEQTTTIVSYRIKGPGGGDIYCCASPIMINRAVIGYLILERVVPYDNEEKNLISLSTDFMGMMLERIIVQKELEKQYNMYRAEVSKIRKIQSSLMPDFKKMRGFDIASAFMPAQDISGDFFDGYFIDREKDVYQIVLCDVSGHGMASSYIGNEIRSLFRTFSHRTVTPAQVIKAVNDIVTRDISALYYFGTVVVCQINLATGEVLLSSGGHPPAIIYREGLKEVDVIETTGPLVGFFENAEFTDTSFFMESGDALLLYTDGVTETPSSAQDGFFGDSRLKELFKTNIAEVANNILISILGSVYDYGGYESQFDDITMICVKKV